MSPTPISLPDLRRTFAEPPADARPMMRWWWFGPDVTRADIDRDLGAMAAGGIGGVEVACVYPLSDHPNPFLSRGFLDDLRYAAEQAERLGLRFDLTLHTTPIADEWPKGHDVVVDIGAVDAFMLPPTTPTPTPTRTPTPGPGTPTPPAILPRAVLPGAAKE